jgi:hypothetical protein
MRTALRTARRAILFYSRSLVRQSLVVGEIFAIVILSEAKDLCILPGARKCIDPSSVRKRSPQDDRLEGLANDERPVTDDYA